MMEMMEISGNNSVTGGEIRSATGDLILAQALARSVPIPRCPIDCWSAVAA